jgi:flagellar biosynthesis protein FliR
VPFITHHLSFRHIARAMFQHGVALLCLVIFALGIGMFIYHWAAHLPWTDAFLNASMILGGMGPVDRLSTTPSKWLAGFYALFSGLIFLVVAGAMLAPLVHSVLHLFHAEPPSLKDAARAKPRSSPH